MQREGDPNPESEESIHANEISAVVRTKAALFPF
jgi:hypothetical protein